VVGALRRMGERLSAAVIALLQASAETPRMPPCVASEQAFTGSGEDLTPGQADFTSADLPETDTERAELAAAEAIGGELTQEDRTPAADETAVAADTPAPGGDPDLWLYRGRTVGMLRRYMRLSIEVGRMPSLLGREFFRTRITSYKAFTFEDSVIFVHDVERSLERLGEFDKQLIAKIVLQEYSQEEAGRQLGWGLRHTARCYVEALDRVTEVFLRRGLLTRLPCTKPKPEKSCQGGKTGEFPASDSEQAENKRDYAFDASTKCTIPFMVREYQPQPLAKHLTSSFRREFASFGWRKALNDLYYGSGVAVLALLIGIRFGLSVKTDWEEHATALIAIALLPSIVLVGDLLWRCRNALASVYRGRPHTGFREPVNTGIVLIAGWCFIGIVCWYIAYLSVPHFNMWLGLEDSKQRFHLRISTLEPWPRKSASVFFEMLTISNHGAPGTVKRWYVIATLPDGEKLLGAPLITGGAAFTDEHHNTFIYPGATSIFSQATNHEVKTGGSIHGFAEFEFVNVRMEALGQAGTDLAIVYIDSANHKNICHQNVGAVIASEF
jgi:hypothetical protein